MTATTTCGRPAALTLAALLGGLLGALLGPCAGPAAAATVVLPDGERLTVEPEPVAGPRRLDTRIGLETLAWTLTDRRGREQASGRIPGTLRLTDGGEPALAVSPASGRAFVVSDGGGLPGQGLALRAWTGWGFTDPVSLATGGGAAHAPAMAFLPEGDGVLAWSTGGDTPGLRVQHAELSAAGTDAVLSFGEIADFRRFLRPVGDGVQLRPGLGHLAVDGERATGFAVLASEDGTGAAILGVRLSILDDIWGGSAAPVPVTVSSSSVHPLGDGGDASGGEPGGHPGGQTGGQTGPVASWTVDFDRLRLGGHDLYTWSEDGAWYGLLVRDGRVWPLIRLVGEADPDAARATLLRAAWREIVRSAEDRSGSQRRTSDGR